MNILDKLSIAVSGPAKKESHDIKNGPIKGNLKSRSGAIAASATERMDATINKAKNLSGKLQAMMDNV